jgi:hypothetical protein
MVMVVRQITSLTRVQILLMVPGCWQRDYAIIRPPRANDDWDGTKFGPHPIRFTWSSTTSTQSTPFLGNFVSSLLSGHVPRKHSPRVSTLFHTHVDSTVDTYLHHLLRVHLHKAEAKGFSHETIMTLARWSSDKSILICARIDPEVFTT